MCGDILQTRCKKRIVVCGVLNVAHQRARMALGVKEFTGREAIVNDEGNAFAEPIVNLLYPSLSG